MKKLILEEMYKVVLKLEVSTSWTSPTIWFEGGERGRRGGEDEDPGRVDRVIREISARRDHFELLHKAIKDLTRRASRPDG